LFYSVKDVIILLSYELISDSDLEGNWIRITDYFYADANEDGYIDLVIRFKNVVNKKKVIN